MRVYSLIVNDYKDLKKKSELYFILRLFESIKTLVLVILLNYVWQRLRLTNQNYLELKKCFYYIRIIAREYG